MNIKKGEILMKQIRKILQDGRIQAAFILCSLMQGVAWASDATHQAGEAGGGGGMYAIAAAVAIAIAAFGGAIGQGRVGAAAMEGIARNPEAQKIMFIPMIIVLALIESFVIFSLAIAMILVGKI